MQRGPQAHLHDIARGDELAVDQRVTASALLHIALRVQRLAQLRGTLEPGDVITTGTPPGVGSGKKPPRFLNAGDTISLGIDGLGQQAQRVVAWSAED